MVSLNLTQRAGWIVFGFAACLLVHGCSGGKSPNNQTTKSSFGNSAAANSTNPNAASLPGGQSEPGKSTVRKPLTFGETKPKSTGESGAETAVAQTPASLRAALKPLPVNVGQWDGLTFKKLAGAKGIEAPVWYWDFSHLEEPALAFSSKTSPYLKEGRLTCTDPGKKRFRLSAKDKNGTEKIYKGKFTEDVHDVPAEDGKKLDRTFTLTFTQVSPPPDKSERNYQVAFQQLKNDRYLMIVHRKTGERVFEWDRVANQRRGTSFAGNLDDYGDKTCVVSQGLGTSTVSHNGKTFYVCCSGCRKAFEADPEKWIASFEEWKKANGKK